MTLFSHRIPRITLFLFVVLLLVNALGFVTAGDTAGEYKLKAVFLFNFFKYIQWPDIPDGQAYKAVVLGDSPIIGPLRKITENRQVNGRKIDLLQLSDINEIPPCQILFVSPPETSEIEKITEITLPNNTLIVTDKDGMAKKGSAINFVLENEKVRFELNNKVIEKAGLKSSAKLRNIAIQVE